MDLLEMFQPTWHCRNLKDISPNFLKQQGITTILFDLDNTLIDPYEKHLPSSSWEILNKLSHFFKLYIISNSNSKRVRQSLNSFEIPFLASAKKPRIKRFKQFISEQQIDLTTAVVIGDQLLTDIGLAQRLHVRSILMEPLVPWDLKRSWMNRQIDLKIRSQLQKQNRLRTIE